MFDLFYKRFSEKFTQGTPSKQKILLALSGGPDSLFLYHLLKQVSKKHSFSWAVAHVDHRWRPESQQEAQRLKEQCDEDLIPFYLHHLDPTQLKGNLEDTCRNERWAFFKQVMSEEHYDLLILGHHADDQAETVLKRLFEGASWDALSAMQEQEVKEGIAVWRPLLSERKTSIQKWLKEEYGAKGFIDSSNEDPKYLRSRMRSAIVPDLEHSFGKNIHSNLIHRAEEAAEISSLLHNLSTELLRNGITGPFGTMYPLSADVPIAMPVLKYALKQIALKHDLCLFSRQTLQMISQALIQKKANVAVSSVGDRVSIDRGYLFIFHGEPSPPRMPRESESLLLRSGQFSFGDWRIDVKEEPINKQDNSIQPDWKKLWQGVVRCSLPYDQKTVLSLKNPEGDLRKQLDTVWTNAKIPAMLRAYMPVIVDSTGNAYDITSNLHQLQQQTTSPNKILKLNLIYSPL